jgi:predicted dehydrogenase
MRVAILGYGQRGAELTRLLTLRTDVRIVGVVDPRRENVPDRWPTYPSFTALLQQVVPDLVVIATPPSCRADLVEEAVAHGVKGILVEKPLALNATDARRMEAASRKALIAVGHHWRFCPEVESLRQRVAQGDLGTIGSIHGTCYGNLLDQGWHLLDTARWLLDSPSVDWALAYGHTDSIADANPSHPAPTVTTVHLAMGSIRMTLEAGPLFLCKETDVDRWHHRYLVLRGSKGYAECRPGHYLRVYSEDQPFYEERAAPDTLETATITLIDKFVEAVRDGGHSPTPVDDACKTLEGLLLCGQSLQSGGLVRAPLAHEAHPFDEGIPASLPMCRPRFSVLIPLEEHRGHLANCLDAWFKNQSVAASSFEVIVLSDGHDSEAEKLARGYLRQGDQLVMSPRENQSGLYDLGARQARGEFLLITESHCTPEAEFLEEMGRFLDHHPELAGACCRSIPVADNPIARMDAQLFEGGYRHFRQPENWQKVNIHGVAIRRSDYFAAGGLKKQYNSFAEMVLAASLRDLGARLGYASGAAVWHHYARGLNESIRYASDQVAGELAYRQEHPGPDRLGITFISPDLVSALSPLQRELTDTLKRVTWRGHRLAIAPWWKGSGKTAGFLARCRSAIRLAGTIAYCHLVRWNPERLKEGVQRIWKIAGQRELLRHSPPPTAIKSWNPEHGLSELKDSSFVGLHSLENYQGSSFRWSGASALLSLELKPGDYTLALDTRGLRGNLLETGILFYFNGQRVPASTIQYVEGILKLPIRESMCQPNLRQTLAWVCRPLRPWKHGVPDQRELGLSLFGIQVNRVEVSEKPKTSVVEV